MPLQALVDKFSHARFEPSGMTKNPEVRFAKSIVDYIFRWMATKFLSPEAQFRAGVNLREEPADEPLPGTRRRELGVRDGRRRFVLRRRVRLEPDRGEQETEFGALRNQEDAPPCSTCGSIMIRSGSCYKCGNWGGGEGGGGAGRGGLRG